MKISPETGSLFHEKTHTVGFYPDALAGEIFLDGGKPGTAMRDMARDLVAFAVIILGIQAL
jgi:hypothetical protein